MQSAAQPLKFASAVLKRDGGEQAAAATVGNGKAGAHGGKQEHTGDRMYPARYMRTLR